MGKDNGRLIILPIEFIAEEYKKGLSTYDLAKKYKVGTKTITRRLKEQNIELRDRVSAAALKHRDRGVNHNYFENIKTQNPAYFTGFIAADGCIYKPKAQKGQARLNLELHKQDLHILESLKVELTLTQKIEFRRVKYVKLTVCSDKIAEDLKQYNIVERKTMILKFPDKLNNDMFRHFIRGFFDGDGCVSGNGKTGIGINFGTGSKEFLESLKEYLEENYFITTKSLPSNVGCKTCYVLSYRSKEAILKLYKLFYTDAELFLTRKKNKFNNLIEEKYNNKTVKYHEKAVF